MHLQSKGEIWTLDEHEVENAWNMIKEQITGIGKMKQFTLEIMKNFLDGWKWFNYNSFIFKEQKSILKSPDSEPEQSGSPAATFQKNRIWEKSSWTDSREERIPALKAREAGYDMSGNQCGTAIDVVSGWDGVFSFLRR